MKNPVAKNMPKSGGGFHNMHKARGQKKQKVQDAIDETDADYIEDCLNVMGEDSGEGDGKTVGEASLQIPNRDPGDEQSN